ncbi:MAG: DUF2203 domain-containing protein [Actinomycetota bacterium]|nr:DUF2203 domain-containing protein [Actinomycetota bacterium]
MRYWTVEEARAELPRVRELVQVLRRAALVGARVNGNGHGPPSTEAVEAAVAELAAGDIVVRDPSVGLIDFPARGDDGVMYFLCYRLDDDDLAWWHLPDEGSPGRKPLPREPGSP